MLNYGKGARLLAKELKLEDKVLSEHPKWGVDKVKREAIKMADDIIRRYFDRMPNVEKHIKEMHRKAADTKFVETALGRRRYLRQIMDWQEQIEHENAAAAEGKKACWCSMCSESRGGDRQAVNTEIQSTAADVAQIAMVAMHYDKSLRECPMLFQVHDEVISESPKELVEDHLKRIKYNMEIIPREELGLIVPLRCSPGFGNNWVEAK